MMTLEASNARYLGLDQAGIQALDQQWVAEREVEDQPLITAVLSSPLSSYLTRIQADSQGLFTAIFVMDRSGLNAGKSAITSDFWQGDERAEERRVGKECVSPWRSRWERYA